MRCVVRNGRVLDVGTMAYRECAVVIEDGRIVDLPDRHDGSAEVEVDATGRFVLPGLIDGHVHFRLATMDFRALASMSEVEFGVRMAALSAETLERGFTTVRDLGGELSGLRRARPG